MNAVAEAVSPGGHTTKCRPRSRPMFQELLESAHHSLSPQVPPHVCYPFPFAIPPLTRYQTHSSRIASPKLPLSRPFCSAQSIFRGFHRGFSHSRLLNTTLTAHRQQRSKSVAQTIHARRLRTCQPTRERQLSVSLLRSVHFPNLYKHAPSHEHGNNEHCTAATQPYPTIRIKQAQRSCACKYHDNTSFVEALHRAKPPLQTLHHLPIAGAIAFSTMTMAFFRIQLSTRHHLSSASPTLLPLGIGSSASYLLSSLVYFVYVNDLIVLSSFGI